MKSETNFCPRCGKPVWRSPADAIHTCSPPDKTRESSHWEGCWATRGHHECAIGRVDRLKRELAEWQNGERQYPPAAEDAQEVIGQLKVARFDIRELERELAEARGLLLWTLYHHQGASSVVGQPIRRHLGIGQHEPMTPEQIATAIDAAREKT